MDAVNVTISRRRIRFKVDRSDRVSESPIAEGRDLFRYVQPIFASVDDGREHLLLVFLDQRNRPVGYHELAVGGWSSATVDVRELFAAVLRMGAPGFALAHNHPSGDPTPSADDIRVTRRIVECAELLALRFVDHIVVGDGTSSWYGFGRACL